MRGVVHHALKRFGSPPAAVPRRATRRVATRQLPQAYPPQRGIIQRNARSPSAASGLEPHPVQRREGEQDAAETYNF
jgi:hypothetical protein